MTPERRGDHVARGRAGGDERRSHRGLDRREEVVDRHLVEGDPVRERVGDQVERDVDAPRLRGDRVGVAVDGVLVEGVDDRRLGHASCLTDAVRHVGERGLRAAGEEDARPLAGEGARDCAADRAPSSVDDRVLLFEQHRRTSSAPWVFRR
jgi:hypothetical protein